MFEQIETTFATNRPSRNDDLMIVMWPDTTMEGIIFVVVVAVFVKAGPDMPAQLQKDLIQTRTASRRNHWHLNWHRSLSFFIHF